MTADAVGLVAAYLAVQGTLGFGRGSDGRLPATGELLLVVAGLPLWHAAARAMGLYDRDGERLGHTTIDDLPGVLLLVTLFVWLLGVLSTALGVASPSVGEWVVFWGAAIGLVAAGRSTARFLARRTAGYLQDTLIVGTDRMAQLIARKMLQHPEYGINVIGFVEHSPDGLRVGRSLRSDVSHLPVLGKLEDLFEIARRNDVDRVVIAFPLRSGRGLIDALRQLQLLGTQVDIVPRLYEMLAPNARVHSIEGIQLVSSPPARGGEATLRLKRAFDAIVASALLIVGWPLLAAIAIWIKLDSPGPVLFRQTRLGRHQRPFVALKFRTMRVGTSPHEHREYIRRAMDSDTTPEESGLYKLDRQDSTTRAGRWLRRTSIDELPQLLNVLRGDMSLVGPRPCIPYETAHFEPHHFERFSVPAGITGLWQVKARARSTFAEALEMDVAYARSRSFFRDLLILLETPKQVIKPTGTR